MRTPSAFRPLAGQGARAERGRGDRAARWPRVALALAAAVALLGLAFAPAAFAEGAFAEPAYPAFTAPVVDDAHVLSPADQAAIVRKLDDLQKSTGVQFVVATVPSLGGDEIEPYANALFRKWGIGQKGVNNGLLLVLAPNQRKLRFEVGYGLEGTFTDVQSKLILHNTMVPKLKAGDPAGALKGGVDDAILVLTKDKASLPARLKPDDSGDDTISLIAFVAIVLFIMLVFWLVRRRGGGGGSGWVPGFTAGSATGSTWSSGSTGSDSGGFSGGGGGDSGGGGASDSY